MYNEQSVRMELNRDNIKYDKTGFDDTVFLMYQYASAFAKKHADVKTYLSAAIQTANQRRTDSTASASVTMIMESWRACFSIQQYKWKTAWVGRRRPRKRSQKHAHLHF